MRKALSLGRTEKNEVARRAFEKNRGNNARGKGKSARIDR